MHFTIGMCGRILRARFDAYRRRVEFSDGRPALPVHRGGSALERLRRAFPGCWIMDPRGRSHPPLDGAAG